MDDKKSDCDAANTTIDTLRQIINDKEDLLQDVLSKNKPAHVNTTVDAPRKKVLLLGDNKEEIIKHIDMSKVLWETINKPEIASLESLLVQSKSKSLAKSLGDYWTIVLILGAQDIVNKKHDIIRSLKDCIKVLLKQTKAKIVICQLAPSLVYLSEFKMFNMDILKLDKHDRVQIIKTENYFLEEPKSYTVQSGIKLTEHGAKIVSDALKEATVPDKLYDTESENESDCECVDSESTDSENDYEQHRNGNDRRSNVNMDKPKVKKTMYDVDADMIKHIIGQKGTRVDEIESLTGARLKTDTVDRNGKEAGIIFISGTENQIKSAIKEIEHIVQQRKLRESTNEAEAPFYKTRPCKFYQLGTCRLGSKCTYVHDNDSDRKIKKQRTK